jgi:transcriptional regulator with XRE-family HTH domain
VSPTVLERLSALTREVAPDQAPLPPAEVRALRLRVGISLHSLAGVAGISPQTLSYFENGYGSIGRRAMWSLGWLKAQAALKALATGLGVDVVAVAPTGAGSDS